MLIHFLYELIHTFELGNVLFVPPFAITVAFIILVIFILAQIWIWVTVLPLFRVYAVLMVGLGVYVMLKSVLPPFSEKGQRLNEILAKSAALLTSLGLYCFISWRVWIGDLNPDWQQYPYFLFNVYELLFVGGHLVVLAKIFQQLRAYVLSFPVVRKSLNHWLWQKVGRRLALFLVVYWCASLVLGPAFWLLWPNTPQASRFFVINAAIKNTCFLDPERENCPHTLEEISYIEPQYYQAMMYRTQVQYQYNPEINQYSLAVRYEPTKAVVFDWRLVPTETVDFKEYSVSLFGQDKIVNPPEWDGPWVFPEWKYW